uniref:ATP synthase F0 subunit 8 n=1 Tax=Lefroyothrips lefroyi TaxID=1030666 RepID=UPI00292A4071|nr:ATP synthase F0 subunit 8 [Lefroyothrips lefroyi]WNL54547.1 ATP synthase subunit 8 [Lefroyothrips lefroyi]
MYRKMYLEFIPQTLPTTTPLIFMMLLSAIYGIFILIYFINTSSKKTISNESVSSKKNNLDIKM